MSGAVCRLIVIVAMVGVFARQACAAELPIAQRKSSAHASVSITLEPSSPTSADVLTLTLRAETRPGFEMASVRLDEHLPEGWRVVGTDEAPAKTGTDGSRTSVRIFRLEPFLPGDVQIKPFDVPIRPVVVSGDASKIEAAPDEHITTDAIVLTVRSVLPKDDPNKNLADVKGVVESPFKFGRGFWIVVGSVVLVGAAIAAVLVAAARQSRVIRLVRRTAHACALQRLDSLLARDLIGQGDVKGFYLELSFILRRYIEDRYGLHAPERTTEEFLHEAKTSNVMMAGDVDVLERFLSHCDLVKFAGMTTDRTQAEVTVATVREFIDRTRSDELQVVVDPKTGQERRLADAPEIRMMIERGKAR